MQASDMEKFLQCLEFPNCEQHPHEKKEIVCLENNCDYHKKLQCTICFYGHNINHRNYTIKSLLTFVEYNQNFNKTEEINKNIEFYPSISKMIDYVNIKIEELIKMKNELIALKNSIDIVVQDFFSENEKLRNKFVESFHKRENSNTSSSKVYFNSYQEEILSKYLKNLNYNFSTNKLQFVNFEYFKVLNDLKMKHQEQYYDIYKQLNQPPIEAKAEDKIFRISELKENASKPEAKEIQFKSERDFRSSNLSEQPLKPSAKQTLNLFEQGSFSNSLNNKNSRIISIYNQK
jgi:hypothetical protein